MSRSYRKFPIGYVSSRAKGEKQRENRRYRRTYDVASEDADVPSQPGRYRRVDLPWCGEDLRGWRCLWTLDEFIDGYLEVEGRLPTKSEMRRKWWRNVYGK